jgi:NADH dehydrogenase/NADH oxidase (H2O2-forming)
MDHYDVIVIGGGPAAISFVKTMGNAQKTAVIRPEDHSLIYCAMPYAIEGLLPMAKTFKKDELVTDTGAVLVRDTVTKVDLKGRVLQTMTGKQYGYDRLVIATGARPVLPPLPGSDLAGVFTFKTEDEMRAIQRVVDAGIEKAVVVGAGPIGVELAQAFSAKGIETHIVDIASRILPNILDEDMAEEPQEQLAEHGIRLHLGHGVSALHGNPFVEEVVLDNGSTIRFDQSEDCETESCSGRQLGIVVFSVGVKPNVELFVDSGLALDKQGIVINDRLETNIPGVFAIGDCASYTSGITGEPMPGKLATNAVPMGKILGRGFNGKPASYVGFYNGSATKIGKWFVGGTGFTVEQAARRFPVNVGTADLTTTFPIMPSSRRVRMKLVMNAETGMLVGGQVVSGEPVADKIDQLTMAIQYGIPVEKLVDFSYASQPYQSYYPADNLIAHAARDALK